MPATFKLILAPRADGDGLHDVRLRVTAERVVRYFNVPGVSIAAKYWNAAATTEKENWIKAGHFEHAEFNDTLFSLLRRAKKLDRERPGLSADELKRILSTGEDLKPAPIAESADFIDFCFKSLARDDRGTLAEASCALRHSILTKLARWWDWQDGKKPLRMEQFTEERIADFDAYMRQELRNTPSTRRKSLDIVSVYINRAIKRNELARHANPLQYYDLPTPTPTRVWLTETELSALEAVALPGLLHVARATYFIQYYLHGSRIGAVLRLKWRQRGLGVVRFKMDKGDREKLVQESAQLTALLDSFLPADGSAPNPEAYILPWLSSRYEQMAPFKALQEMKRATFAMNTNLKRAGAAAGITTNFSSHSSRRTLADQADELTGDMGVVQGLLGHTARATTEKYTQGRDTPAVHRGARQVYDHRPMPQVKPG
jgi:integrase